MGLANGRDRLRMGCLRWRCERDGRDVRSGEWAGSGGVNLLGKALVLLGKEWCNYD